MTTTISRSGASRAARLVTDGLDPKTWIIADTLLIGWHTGRLTGVAWGLLGCLFAAGIPLAFIKYGIHRGRWADRHVGQRPQRILVMAFAGTSVATGTLLLWLFGAPRPMIALIAAMLVTLAALLAVTPAWKISVHAGVSSGSAAMIAMTYGPRLLLAYPLVALVGWSRVRLRDHTPAQVLAGAALGGAAAAGTFALLR
ncbi:phosphatase PAP2 family protein [Streptomyces virginiae]|uniref:phosphatase PAP2 family protein n=1 Tax=Streptomyces virginiae TaxID=1961 RepID=UPI00343CC766